MHQICVIWWQKTSSFVSKIPDDWTDSYKKWISSFLSSLCKSSLLKTPFIKFSPKVGKITIELNLLYKNVPKKISTNHLAISQILLYTRSSGNLNFNCLDYHGTQISPYWLTKTNSQFSNVPRDENIPVHG